MNTDSDPKRLSLIEALTQWTEPALVAKVKIRERHYSPANLAYFTSMTRRPRLSDEIELRQPGTYEWMIGTPDYGLLIAAHMDLVQDICDRMTRSEFYLRGVQTRPILTTETQDIAGVWGAECSFEFAVGCLTVSNVRFAAVTVSRTPEADAGDGQREDPVEAPEIPSGTVERGGRGRESMEPLTLEALLERWDAVQVAVEKGESWTTVADWLRKYLERKHPEHVQSKKLPLAETIRTRLQRLYQGELWKQDVLSLYSSKEHLELIRTRLSNSWASYDFAMTDDGEVEICEATSTHLTITQHLASPLLVLLATNSALVAGTQPRRTVLRSASTISQRPGWMLEPLVGPAWWGFSPCTPWASEKGLALSRPPSAGRFDGRIKPSRSTSRS